jgi:Domain of unknown function (DUF4874)/Domain of unknown function (DUF4832)
MRTSVWICLVTLAALGCENHVAPIHAISITNTFSPTDTTISTSEGAPYGFCDFWGASTAYCSHETNYGYGPTKVIQVYICLSGEVTINACSQQPAVTGPLSAGMLNDIDTRLGTYAGTGMRLLLRFTYNFGPIGPGAMDAPIDVISEHIDQLAPIVLRHRDLVFALEAGFIGTWGEWHDSTHGNDTASAQKVVLDKELSYFGGVFPILVRTPGALIQYAGSLTPPAGFGIHDDFYASGSTDANTFNPCGPTAGYCLPQYTSSQFQAYAAQISTSTMFAGEMAQTYAPLQSCSALSAYSYTYHPQSISIHPPDSVGASLQAQGCALSFYNKTGTRIELRSATIAGRPAPNGQLTIGLTMVNAGFGRVIRARPATVVVLVDGNVAARAPLALAALDLRQLTSAPTPQAQTFQFTVTLPPTFPTTDQAWVALLFPDPAPSLTSQAAYALPLNSVDATHHPVFDPTTGYNIIGSFRAQ